MEENEITQVNSKQFEDVKLIIEFHSAKALREVNHELVLSAWEVGGYISAQLKTASWGSQTIKHLSEYLRKESPSLRGYSRRHLYNMVEFYNCYTSSDFDSYMQRWPQLNYRYDSTGRFVQPVIAQIQPIDKDTSEIVQSLIAQLRPIPQFLLNISFSNHIIIINGCKNMDARIFYTLYSYREHLTTRPLQRAIHADAMGSLLGDGHNLSEGLMRLYPEANLMIKDRLMVDFLGLPQKHSEHRLHKSIIDHGKEFMAELGNDFLFMGSEYPLEVGGSTFKIDLLYYHRGLQCLVAIELKATPFKPSYMGQLEFYLEALDRDVRRSNENPSIGILLCQESNRTIVEYAMSRSLSPTMVAEYERKLISKEIMQRSLDEFVGFISSEVTNDTK